MDGNDLAGFVDKIAALVKRAEKPELVSLPLEKKGVYGVTKPDGTIETMTAEPAWHRESLIEPFELVGFFKELSRRNEEGVSDAAVFVEDDKISLIYDLNDRRDRVTVALTKTQPFLDLDLNKAVFKSQVDFVRFLRINLRGTLPPDSNILQLVRNLRFASSNEATGSIQQGRESLGKQITNAVMGEDALPDEIVLAVQVYENFPRAVRIACALEINSADRNFRLTPYPMEMVRAVREIHEMIRESLEINSPFPPIFLGSANAKD